MSCLPTINFLTHNLCTDHLVDLLIRPMSALLLIPWVTSPLPPLHFVEPETTSHVRHSLPSSHIKPFHILTVSVIKIHCTDYPQTHTHYTDCTVQEATQRQDTYK